MDLKERLEVIEGMKLTYEVQGYISTNDADYLIETIHLMKREINKLKAPRIPTKPGVSGTPLTK